MTVTHVGSSKKYASGWADIFVQPQGKKSATKTAKKAAGTTVGARKVKKKAKLADTASGGKKKSARKSRATR